MAICKRCGAVFDYEKWDGVCPKCCLYNRPDDGREEDDCWMDNYNIDDNSFRFPLEHTETDHHVKAGKSSAYNQATRPTNRVNVPRKENQKTKKSPKGIIFAVVLIYVIFMVILPMLMSFF